MLFGNRPLKTQNAKFNPYFLDNAFYTTMRYATPSALMKTKGIFPNLVQSTAANQPSVSGGIVTFDGVDDFYTNDTSNTATYVKQTQMPDASGSDTGKGFTCTGLSRDSEGNWWFANFGLNKNGNSGQQPSIVKTDSNMNLLKEILLKPIDNTITGVQGLQIEKATNYAWVAVSDLGKVYIIDTNNSSLVKTFTVDAAPNGIALDEVNQRFFILYVNANSTPIVKSYSMSNGAFIEEFTGFTGLTFGDHLFYDTETQILWVVTGSNAYNAGRLYAYSTNRKVVSGSVGLMEGDAVEGIYLDFSTNKLYVANDAYFHELDINAGGDATLKNSLLEYDFDASFLRAQYYKAYTELEVDIVMDAFSIPAASVIYQIDDPLNTNNGISIYAANTATIRIFVGSGSGWESFDFTLNTNFSGDVNNPIYSHLSFKFDFTNKLISVFQDGVSLGATQSWAGSLAALTYSKAQMGASAVPDRYIGMKVKEFAVTDKLRSVNDVNELGKYWAARHGLTWKGLSVWAMDSSLELDGALPSLVLQFDQQRYASNYTSKNFSDIITFTRAGDGTYFDANGVMQTASTDVPRFDYDPTTGEALGFLEEGAATNYMTRSVEIDQWTLNGSATVNANNLTSPDGTVNADTVNMSTPSWSGVWRTSTKTVSIGDVVTFTYRIKNISGGTKVKLGSDGSAFSSQATVTFDASTNTFSNVGSQVNKYSYIEYTKAGQNWIEIRITATATASAGVALIFYNGSGITSSWGLWGVQLEDGDTSTSFIYTTSAAVTRSKDVIIVDGVRFSDVYNQTKGTIYADVIVSGSGAFDYLFSANDGTFNERTVTYLDNGLAPQFKMVDGGVTQMDIGAVSGSIIGSRSKNVFAYELNNSTGATDGTTATTDTVNTLPTVTQLEIGNQLATGVPSRMHWKELRIYPNRGLNASLATLTQ